MRSKFLFPRAVTSHLLLSVFAVGSSVVDNPEVQAASQRATIMSSRRMDFISPHFPQEGIDYLTGNGAGVIFNMSKTSGTVLLSEGIEVPRPTSIATVKPSSDLLFQSETSTVMTLSKLSSSIAKSYGDKWDLSIPVGKALGVDVGGSRDKQLQWARAQMKEAHRYAVVAKVTYDYVEVTTKPPTNADLSKDFLRAFAILPPGEWESLTDASKRAYSSFLSTYGTHYVRSAKFGGSYENVVIADACTLVLSSEQGSSLSECANLKLSVIFQDLFGIAADIASAESCRGLTSADSVTDAWKSSSVKSRQRWLGGSFGETDAFQFNDIGTWVEDVKKHPRSFPTQLASIPDMFRDLHGAYVWSEEYCLPCQKLKDLNFQEEVFGSLVRNLDYAFDELLVRAKNEKLESEVCTFTCGACGEDPPLEGCTCPEPDIAACAGAGDEDLMEVTVESVKVELEKDWMAMYKPQNLRLQTSGLGSPYDGKAYIGDGSSVTMTVSSAFTRKKGDTVNVEVYDEYLGIKKCVGSANYLLEWVGSGKAMNLNGPCTDMSFLSGDQRVGKNPIIWIDGSVKFPNCCECAAALAAESAAPSSPYVSVRAALFLTILAALSLGRIFT